ncbi:MAG: methyltransferase domain-containing protein [Burkholderiales bacterium]
MTSLPPRRAWAAAVLAVLLLCGCSALKRFAYEGFGRDGWQKPEEVVAALGLRAGDRVADIGSGSGYFTLRLARAVGPSGKVYAVDIDRGMNAALAERAREAGLANVEIIDARVDDSMLPASSVDLLFVSDTYHHIADRVPYFRNAAKTLRPGGRLAVIDFDGRGWFERFIGHITPPETIKKEMQEAGYRLPHEFAFLERQAFLVFPAPAR